MPDWIKPRFTTYGDAKLWHETGDASKAIPTHIQDGNRIVPNPVYHSAPYEGDFVFSDGKR